MPNIRIQQTSRKPPLRDIAEHLGKIAGGPSVKRLIGIARKNGGHGIEDQCQVNSFSPLWVCRASSHQTWRRRIGWRERS
jgi:hypothetical protein